MTTAAELQLAVAKDNALAAIAFLGMQKAVQAGVDVPRWGQLLVDELEAKTVAALARSPAHLVLVRFTAEGKPVALVSDDDERLEAFVDAAQAAGEAWFGVAPHHVETMAETLAGLARWHPPRKRQARKPGAKK